MTRNQNPSDQPDEAVSVEPVIVPPTRSDLPDPIIETEREPEIRDCALPRFPVHHRCSHTR